MAYDPQRKHQRRRVTEEDGPAPVDTLLDETASPPPVNGSSPTVDTAVAATEALPDNTASMPERVPPVPDPPSEGYAEAADRRLVIAVAGTVVVACILLARRRRRRRRRAS